MATWQIIRCGHCGSKIRDSRWITYGYGPPAFECGHCRKINRTSWSFGENTTPWTKLKVGFSLFAFAIVGVGASVAGVFLLMDLTIKFMVIGIPMLIFGIGGLIYPFRWLKKKPDFDRLLQKRIDKNGGYLTWEEWEEADKHMMI